MVKKSKGGKAIIAKVKLKKILPTLFSLLIISGLIYKAYNPILTSPPGLRKDELLMYWTYGNEVVKSNFFNYFQLGLWDNISGLGYPLVGHISTQFYPFTLLFYLIPNIEFASRFTFILHLILGGCAFFYLMKVLKCDNLSSILGSVAFVVNTYVTTILLSGFPSEIYNLVWTPLSIAFFWKSISQNSKFFAVLSGISIAMNILSMTLYAVYHNVFLIISIFVGFIIYRYFNSKSIISYKKITFLLVVVFAVAIGISAIKLFSILEYTSYSIRQQLPLYGGLEGKGGAWDLATYQSIYTYLTHSLIPKDSVSNRYVPITLVFFILTTFSLFRKSKEVVIFVSITIICLIATMGRNFIFDLYTVFYYIFPPLQSQYTPNRFFIDTNLTLALLASIGLSVIYNFLQGKSKIIALSVVSVISISTAIPLVTFTHNQMFHLYKKQFYISKAYPLNEVNQEVARVKNKSNEITHIASTNYYVYDYTALINGYRLTNPMHRDYSMNFRDFQFYWERLPDDQIHKKYKLLGLMNSQYIVAQKDRDDFPNKYITPIVTREKWGIYQINDYLTYYSVPTYSILLLGKNNEDKLKSFKAKILTLNENFGISKFTILTSDKEKLADIDESEILGVDGLILYDTPQESTSHEENLLRKFKEKGGKIVNLTFYSRYFDDIRYKNKSLFTNQPAEILSVESEKKYKEFLLSFPNKTKQTNIRIKEDSPENRVIEFNSDTENNSLRIASSYFPGWKAYIDNKEVPILMADGMNSAIIVKKPGMHLVTFLYRPTSFYAGVIITIITILIIVIYPFKKLFKFRSNR